jgi:two-component system, NarL family, response regulator DevR
MGTLMARASGYPLKDIGRQALVAAICDAAAGRQIVDSKVTEPIARSRQRAIGLSGQEQRVLQLVVEGKTNKETGAALSLSEKTVKNYLSNAFQKHGPGRARCQQQRTRRQLSPPRRRGEGGPRDRRRPGALTGLGV